jgi:hypothetical protein
VYLSYFLIERDSGGAEATTDDGLLPIGMWLRRSTKWTAMGEIKHGLWGVCTVRGVRQQPQRTFGFLAGAGDGSCWRFWGGRGRHGAPTSRALSAAVCCSFDPPPPPLLSLLHPPPLSGHSLWGTALLTSTTDHHHALLLLRHTPSHKDKTDCLFAPRLPIADELKSRAKIKQQIQGPSRAGIVMTLEYHP